MSLTLFGRGVPHEAFARITRPRGFAAALAVAVAAAAVQDGSASVLQGTPPPPARIEDVRRLLSALADDSMEGRGTGTRGSAKASKLIAAEMTSIGLRPAGDANTFFQGIPYGRPTVAASSTLSVDGAPLVLGRDYSPVARLGAKAIRGNLQVVFGGSTTDTVPALSADQAKGKLVVLVAPAPPANDAAATGGGGARGGGGAGAGGAAGGGAGGAARGGVGRGGGGRGGRGGGVPVISPTGAWAGAAAIAVLNGDTLPAAPGRGGLSTRPDASALATMTPTIMFVSRSAAERLLGAPPSTLSPGAIGRTVRAGVTFADSILPTRNVLGLLRGTDPALRDEYILVDAHYDHLGMRSGTGGDSIFNGADDDASGTVAVLEIARSLAKVPPRRSVLFVTTTGEEVGLIGTNYFIAHPAVPLDRFVANMEIEMIARADSLAGGPGKAWLTGFERSTMGPTLAAAGLAVVQDPRPDQSFFTRSDNIAFARMGIVAHTLSTFNLHTDYHRASDEVSKVEFEHMTAVINIGVRAVQILANGEKMTWLPGGQPPAGRGRVGGQPPPP
jgi:hypothetical protein